MVEFKTMDTFYSYNSVRVSLNKVEKNAKYVYCHFVDRLLDTQFLFQLTDYLGSLVWRKIYSVVLLIILSTTTCTDKCHIMRT